MKRLHMAAKYQKDIKEAEERVKCGQASIHEAEKGKTHAHAERDRARDNLVKAQEVARELKRALLVTVQERDLLKV